MITTAETLEIMAVITACHQRTAPRLDDHEVAIATATTWSELFNELDFSKAELIAAVKGRAKSCSDAPEVADIIRVARMTRQDHLARTATAPENPREPHRFLGDNKAADEAPYPEEWDSDRRLSTYWYAVRLHAMPRTTAGWQALADQHDREHPEAS